MSMEGYRRAQKLVAAKKLGPEALATEQMVQAREWLAPSDLSEEPELANSAYLPYSYMSPYERTQHFYEAYRTYYAVRFQRRWGREPQGFPDRISGLDAGAFTSIWRARQRADALGVPYSHFVIEMMRDADDNGTRELPRPNQLCSDAKLPMLIKRMDELRDAGRFDPFVKAFDARFYAANYVGDVQQVAAIDWMERQINSAGPVRRPVLLHRYVQVDQVFPEAEAIRRFGQELVNEAKAHRGGYTSRPPIALQAVSMSDPGCFGMFKGGHVACGQCPALERCVERRTAIEDGVLERFGVSDVPKERARAAARDRKRRQRERERDGEAMTDQERRRILKEAGDPKVIRKREKDKARRDDKKLKSRH